MNKKNKKESDLRIQVFDSEEKYFDRYTILMGDDVYTMSNNALSPQGVNMYGGEVSEIRGANLGKEIKRRDLPLEVQKAITQRIELYEIAIETEEE